MKKYGLLIGFLLTFGLGVWLTLLFTRQKAAAHTESSAVVLLEQVRQVCQLITLEANLLETYDETNLRPLTLYLPLPTTFNFSKTALLEVQGRVLVGYDLENAAITVDSLQKVMTISNLPKAEILAIDHDLTYRNLDESWFNSFSAKDYTQLQKNAKEVLRNKALEKGLLEQAEEQGLALLESIQYMVEAAGWTVIIEDAPDRGELDRAAD